MADRRLLWALVAVIVRYVTTIQPHARRELARWRQHALAIPDPELRAYVLRPFDTDSSALGAALFAVLAPLRMQRRLVRLLVAYVLLWSYVDVRTERDPDADPRLYDALVEALQSGRAVGLLDGGAYLAALVSACHRDCTALPSWPVVEPIALRLAEDGRTVQAINHAPRREAEARLRAWAACRPGRPWHERCAAASSPLAIHALMALAARPGACAAQAVQTATAYEPVSALGVICDHLVDRSEDRAHANHSYLHYVDLAPAGELGVLAARAARDVGDLPPGRRHSVVLAAMVAMFRCAEGSSADAPDARVPLTALDPPAALLLAILRASGAASRRRGAIDRDPPPPLSCTRPSRAPAAAARGGGGSGRPRWRRARRGRAPRRI